MSMPHHHPPARRIGAVPPQGEPPQVLDRRIGDFIREQRALTAVQVDQILEHQRRHRIRFGEAAVALRLATADDVLRALAQQFHYPCAPPEGAEFHPELVAASDPFGEHAEAFRELRSQLLMGVLAPQHRGRALAVVSADAGDGRSTLAANLAVSFSQLGARTLLVDADMRTPRQHRLFDIPDEAGLSGLLAGRPNERAIHAVPFLPSLHVLPVGAVPPNPLELVQRPAFALLLQELLARFDHVVVDTPAAAHGADARVLAARCGAALVVGRRGATRMKPLQALLDQLGKGQAASAGVVLNPH